MIKRCFVAVILLTFILFGCGRYDNVQPAKDENGGEETIILSGCGRNDNVQPAKDENGGEETMSEIDRILMRYNFNVEESRRVLKEALGTVFTGEISVCALLCILDEANVAGAVQAEYHGNERGGRLDFVCENGIAYFMHVRKSTLHRGDRIVIIADEIYDTERFNTEEDALPIFWIE